MEPVQIAQTIPFYAVTGLLYVVVCFSGMVDGLFQFSGNLYEAFFFGLFEPFFLVSDMIIVMVNPVGQ